MQQEADIPQEAVPHINEDEVKEIIEIVKEAEYFDPTSMAPLTPQSLVCTL
jgi:hypothetical protein